MHLSDPSHLPVVHGGDVSHDKTYLVRDLDRQLAAAAVNGLPYVAVVELRAVYTIEADPNALLAAEESPTLNTPIRGLVAN